MPDLPIEKFRVKPVEVQAVRWNGTAKGATPIINWVLSTGATARYTCSDIVRHAEHNGDTPHWIKVIDANGEFFVHVGEWLVRDGNGKFDRYPRADFEASYEPAGGDRG